MRKRRQTTKRNYKLCLKASTTSEFSTISC